LTSIFAAQQKPPITYDKSLPRRSISYFFHSFSSFTGPKAATSESMYSPEVIPPT